MTITLSFAPTRRKALMIAVAGLVAAGLALAAASAFGAAGAGPLAALLLAGLGLVGAGAVFDAALRREQETTLAAVGEVKVRLATTNIRLEALAQRLDREPMPADEAAPARAALAELTAEVGLLGGLLKNVAQTVSDHEERLQQAAAEAGPEPRVDALPPAPEPAPIAPPLRVASIEGIVRAELRAEAPAAAAARETAEDAARTEAIAAAIGAAAIEVHLQPVVSLPHRRTVGYEAFARLRLSESELLLPAEFMSVVEARGLGPTLDALMLTRVIAIARYLATRPGEQFVSLNISAATWTNSRAVASIARLIENYHDYAPRLVLEVPQRIFRALDPASLGLLGAMSASGARFCLDQLGDLRLDPAGLADRGVRFVKAAAGLMLAAEEGRVKLEIEAADLAPMLARAGVALIGEKVEDDSTAAALIELNIGLAQGLLFAAPRPARPEIFIEPKSWTPEQETVPSAAELAETPVPPQAAPLPERRSFRSLLRKASA